MTSRGVVIGPREKGKKIILPEGSVGLDDPTTTLAELLARARSIGQVIFCLVHIASLADEECRGEGESRTISIFAEYPN